MAERTSDFLDIVNQLTNFEIVLLDELQGLFVPGNFTEQSRYTGGGINQVAPDGKLSMAMVKESPLNEEHRKGWEEIHEWIVVRRQPLVRSVSERWREFFG